VIPDVVDVEVDIRTVPGVSHADVLALLDDALGELAVGIGISDLQNSEASICGTDNALWQTISKHTQAVYPGASLVPGMVVGGTDARYYRYRGRVAYGAGLFSPGMDIATFGNGELSVDGSGSSAVASFSSVWGDNGAPNVCARTPLQNSPPRIAPQPVSPLHAVERCGGDGA